MCSSYVRRTKSTRPERRGVSRRTVIEEAKAKVPTIDLADLLCGPGGLRKQGSEWVGRCPLPDHDDKTPSFTVNPVKDVWWCHGCLRGGDVIELARFAWGYDKREAPMAAADLLHEFGHKIPKRPPSWYRKQERQRTARDLLDAATIRHLQRRVYRMFTPMLDEIEDEAEWHEEARYLWDCAGEIAVCVWAGRRSA